MSTIVVSNTSSLIAALRAAKGGDEIKLAPGTYDAFSISLEKNQYSSNVTVTSLDPAKEAKLTGMSIYDAQNITFRGLEMEVQYRDTGYGYVIERSKNITLENLNVHGSVDGVAGNDGSGMTVRFSENVTVKNSEFHDVRIALAHRDNDGFTVTNNSFHDLRFDGVRGSGSDNVVISKNYFANFFPEGDDHPDAIQFWTLEENPEVVHNITISENVIVRGTGAAMQGIFIRDEGGVGYANIKITDNLIVGSQYHGISVDSATGLAISGNTIVGLPDQTAWIRVINSTDATLSNNVAPKYVSVENVRLVQVNDRVSTGTVLDGGKAAQATWLAAHPTVATLMLDGAKLVTTAQLDLAATAAVNRIETVRVQSIIVKGTAAADRLSADGQHDMRMEGGDGNDQLTGGGVGHNTMVGGAGDDTYTVLSKNDIVIEDANGGADDLVVASVDFTLPENVERLRMMAGATYGEGNQLANKITGTLAADTIRGQGGDDVLSGQDGDDHIFGGTGADTIDAGAGHDTVAGDDGADKLMGGAGNDSLAGGGGNDSLEGAAGADTMSGGAGADVFAFRDGEITMTPDYIMDFSRAEGDRINLGNIDANTTIASNQSFTFIGTSAFHNKAGELRFEIAAGQTNVYGDLNGDGVADFKLVMPGAGTLVSADFVL